MGQKGRPRLTTQSLVEKGLWPENWKEVMYEMGKNGKSKTHLMEHFDLARESFYKLYNRDSDFRDAVNKTMNYSQNWWMNIAQKRWIEGTEKNINSNHWSLIMRNMFKEDWSDRKEMDLSTLGDKIKGDNDIVVKIIPPKDLEDEE